MNIYSDCEPFVGGICGAMGGLYFVGESIGLFEGINIGSSIAVCGLSGFISGYFNAGIYELMHQPNNLAPMEPDS